MNELFLFSTDKTLLDTPLIHSFLTNTYWAKGLPYENLLKRIHNSLCFGMYDMNHKQVGFARVITDFESFAYLADVFIVPEHQKKGLSKDFMAYIMSYPDLQNLRRFMLATQDAQGLYQKFGFSALSNPEKWMEKTDLTIYEKN